ncbi:hypothetical protein PT974_09447 [Cladobotryum mycophilum]|uniref:Uncharacterized protein n=1 Tax=Cladobotryum mycophilum TaxID=491253 RepID=A0ABR0SG79_9HYPO
MKFCEGFGNRRKSKPRDLHIRKVSFSGSSVSSGSFSSTSSVSTAREHTPRVPSTTSSAFFDPLSCHPTFQAPPRLHERPFIPMEGRRYEDISTFYDDGEDDSSEFGGEHQPEEEQFHMELPPHHGGGSEDYQEEPQDYFFMHLAKRPQLRSRWSESTIATIQTLEELTPVSSVSNNSTSCAIADADEEADAAEQEVPNFSYKRNTVTKRPTFKPVDSFDDFVKRGGWKRRGIVFHNEDMEGNLEVR